VANGAVIRLTLAILAMTLAVTWDRNAAARRAGIGFGKVFTVSGSVR
jgi:hypothetical protein